ncbi:hypothetical protein CEXT_716131 [Caerostris extrusa]|uniref:Uncharacterized protein n=1 Tax=Caerostris extrusa TaxID=172846 RepID=A0AAV4PYY8_CAEEX|nr:hypothetical protein CEXT_716131 [Caerostris extrusa]
MCMTSALSCPSFRADASDRFTRRKRTEARCLHFPSLREFPVLAEVTCPEGGSGGPGAGFHSRCFVPSLCPEQIPGEGASSTGRESPLPSRGAGGSCIYSFLFFL